MKKKKHIGSSFEDFLKEEGIFEETTTQAVKRVLSWQISQAMKEKGISKMEMANDAYKPISLIALTPNDKVLETSSESGIGYRQRVSLSLEDNRR
jgi:hypothetical protein